MKNASVFLTIITVHFQDYSRLRITLDSILPKLGQAEFEWVVVDGGSVTDCATEQSLMATVRRQAQTFVSEPDDGIYDAMNKGMKFAKGEYVLYLNAGDKLLSDFSLSSIKTAIGNLRPDMIWGRVRFEYPNGSFGIRGLRGPKWLVYGMPVCHQSVLFLRERFSEMQYDSRYLIAADYDLVARAVRSGAKVELLNDVISEYSKGGVSQQNRRLSLTEEGAIRAERFGIPMFLSNILTFIKGWLWKLSDLSPAFNRVWRKRI